MCLLHGPQAAYLCRRRFRRKAAAENLIVSVAEKACQVNVVEAVEAGRRSKIAASFVSAVMARPT